MDSITQGLLGATIAEGGFRKKLGRKAVWFGLLAGVAPDLDVVTRLWGGWVVLVHHRGFTHSFLAMPVLVPFLAWMGYRWARRRAPPGVPETKVQYLDWLHLTAWVLITHVLLDVWTSYGTLVLYPLNWWRPALDGVYIVDFFYTAPLLYAVVTALRGRAPRDLSRRLARVVLVATTAYLLLGLGMSFRARSLTSAQLEKEGFEPSAVRAIPTFSNVVLWRVVARNERGDIRVGHVSSLCPRSIRFLAFRMPEDTLASAALASDRGRAFLRLADGMVSAEVQKRKDATTVFLSDRRYGLVSEPTWSPFLASADFDSEGSLKEVSLVRNLPETGLLEELAMMWHLAWGGEAPALAD